MLIILPYLQLAAGHAGCYGLQGRFISKNSLFSYSDDISSRYPGMLKDIPSCIRLLTDLRSKIHQYVPCGIPCNAHLETCGFSPASAGAENATAGSEASRSTEGALRIFPSFSWSGKCDSRERSESEHRRCVIPANSRAEEGPMREFPGFSRFGTNRSGLLASDPPLQLRTSQLYNRPSCRRTWLVLRQVFTML